MLGRCHDFWYDGCESNGNNFNSLKDCIQMCGKLIKVTDFGIDYSIYNYSDLTLMPLKASTII